MTDFSVGVLRHDGVRLKDRADPAVAADERPLVGHHVHHLEDLDGQPDTVVGRGGLLRLSDGAHLVGGRHQQQETGAGVQLQQLGVVQPEGEGRGGRRQR